MTQIVDPVKTGKLYLRRDKSQKLSTGHLSYALIRGENMKKRSRLALSFALLLTTFAPVAGWQQQDNGPKFDRETFQKSGVSIARPDMLACRNKDARVTRGSDAKVEAFAKALNGVWVNSNRRSVHGAPVETDAAFYIEMHGNKGWGILIDRNNLGDTRMTGPYLGASRYAKPTKPLMWTFINCQYQFFDQYVKVSDQVPRDALAGSTGARISARMSLNNAWEQIVKAGFFNSFNMLRSRGTKAARSKIAPTLGDGTRIAVLPSGQVTNEKRITDGNEPGSEYNLPMVTGALFQISLTPKKGEGRQFQGIFMNWIAEYRGVGIGLKIGEEVPGSEEGEFLMEGDAFVCPPGSAEWTTSECGEKNGLVQNSLVFDRVVIGTP